MIVVDASIVVKLYLGEANSDLAERLFTEHRRAMAAPDLLSVEVASATVRRANIDKAMIATSRRALTKWTASLARGVVALYPTDAVCLARVGDLALTLGHPLADCLYLALVIDLDASLVTADARFVPKARTLWPRVELLGEAASA